MGSAPSAHKGFPNSLPPCRPALRLPSAALRVGDTPPLVFASPAGVGQGQGVSITDTAIQFKSKDLGAKDMPKTFTLDIGDKVAYSVQFLRNIGQSHSAMARGRGIVTDRNAVTKDFVLITIDWNGADLPSKVNEQNLAKVGSNTRFCA
jgi:hypothetical protein